MNPEILPLEDTAALSDVPRQEQAAAGLAAFFAMVAEWNLSVDDARTLLGNMSRSRYYEMRRGKAAAIRSLSDDELDRLAYLAGIYTALHILYTPASHTEWLRNESALPAEAMYRPWGMDSPLSYMLNGKLKALADVYEYLNGERGGM